MKKNKYEDRRSGPLICHPLLNKCGKTNYVTVSLLKVVHKCESHGSLEQDLKIMRFLVQVGFHTYKIQISLTTSKQ